MVDFTPSQTQTLHKESYLLFVFIRYFRGYFSFLFDLHSFFFYQPLYSSNFILLWYCFFNKYQGCFLFFSFPLIKKLNQTKQNLSEFNGVWSSEGQRKIKRGMVGLLRNRTDLANRITDCPYVIEYKISLRPPSSTFISSGHPPPPTPRLRPFPLPPRVRPPLSFPSPTGSPSSLLPLTAVRF